MKTHASGHFDIQLSPQEPEAAAPASIGRMLIDKRYHGDLTATGQGQMLAIGTAIEGSAGYVAIEVVDGSLRGHRGSFVLQHSACLDRGHPEMSIRVVPDSGTDQLAGLTGELIIQIHDGKHTYAFDYDLPEPS